MGVRGLATTGKGLTAGSKWQSRIAPAVKSAAKPRPMAFRSSYKRSTECPARITMQQRGSVRGGTAIGAGGCLYLEGVSPLFQKSRTLSINAQTIMTFVGGPGVDPSAPDCK